jgi:5-methylcytosine-specific restriction enzyme subunit McrC
LTEHYKPAIELARLVLASSSAEFSSGPVTASGFFVDLATVFEDFLIAAIRSELNADEEQLPQGAKGRSLYLDRESNIRLKPDLSFWEAGDCLFVGDAKYKHTPDNTGVKNPDVYQLLAYTEATGLDYGLLVYAEGFDSDFTARNSATKLAVRCLDLDQPPDKLLCQVGTLAEQISSQIERTRVKRLTSMV